MNKLKMHTPDFTDANVSRIAELFPNCITESKDDEGNAKNVIDFDLLRQELSAGIIEGPRERFHIDWPGKRDALLIANTPILRTLRPNRAESVNFSGTKNLFIEGDNLEALKLLQETYLNKIKMIYIDPPYNTGGDFIYSDHFVSSVEEYSAASGQKDAGGGRLVANPESDGRFHSRWASMMYPRLHLARNLLADSGVIFISCDDNEVHTLRSICNEIFGSANHVGTIVWHNATDNNPTQVAVEHEYIHVYSRNRSSLQPVWRTQIADIKQKLETVGQEFIEKYSDPNVRQQHYTIWFRENKAFLWPLDRYKYIDSQGIYTGSQSVHNPGREGYRYDVIHPVTKKPCKMPLMGYRFPPATMNEMLDAGKILFGEDDDKIIEIKVYANEFEDKLSSVFALDGRLGAYDLAALFPKEGKVFTNPKPVRLLEHLMAFVLRGDDLFLDFFAGSCASIEALFKLSRANQTACRFIAVQLAEPVADDNEAGRNALKAGFSNIAEIGRERIRRAGNKTKEEAGLQSQSLDFGFRVLKVDTSNMKDVYYQPDAVSQATLGGFVNNVKDDRTDEDLLFQVLLDWGVDLTLSITPENINGKTVYFMDTDALAACFEAGIDETFIKELAKRKPLRAVFRDTGYGSDATKINVEQIFKLLSPATEVKSI